MRTEVPSPFGPEAVPGWLPRHAELIAAPSAVELVLGARELEPAGLVLLACLRAARAAEGRETRVAGDAEAAALLAAAAPVGDLRTARRVADSMAASLEESLTDAAPSVVRAARFVFEELGANIVQHSDRPETGFGAMQSWPERDGGRFQLAFCDAGIGFLASLSRHSELESRIADDGEAIQLAVEKGLSGVGGRSNMGIGLGLLLDLSDRLGADLRIASGSALWHRRTVARSHRVGSLRATAGYQGAWICLDAPAFPT